MRKTIRQCLAGQGRGVVLGVAGLAAGATLAPDVSRAATEVFKDVIIRNTAAEAIPVALTDNTVTLASNGVVVENGTDDPVAVTVMNPGRRREPFQVSFNVPFSGRNATARLYTVPAGTLLTIEHARVSYPKGAALTVATIAVQCPGDTPELQSGGYHLPRLQTGSEHEDAGGALVLHARAGHCIQAFVTADEDMSGVYASGIISGYLTAAN